MNRAIPIILDEWVSRDFGTGAVKVTPAHDPNDFALGQRHNLPSISVMDDTAHINEQGGPYAGQERFLARKHVVADLEAQGLLAGIRDHVHNVGHCDRCKTVVEPRLSLQWFIKIQPLADRAIAAVKEGHIRFTPEMYEKTYLNWMENIHDWCISRQLWWGHRIPAWQCAKCNKMTVARQDPTQCAIAARKRSRKRPTCSTPGSPRAFCPSPSSAGPTSPTKRGQILTPSIPPAYSSPASTFFSSGWRA